ncbi:MAG: transketolase [Elusimicrobiota bacterium]|jgi:transketolase|nr:transketolase [Elusimicrobiota bacterium]
MKETDLKIISANVRKDIIKMITIAGSGHPGGSLSAVELMVSLYFNHINLNSKNYKDENRDYFVLSKGHVCPVLYAVLSQIGCFDNNELWTLRKSGSRLQGHPASDKELPGIEISTGSLGYGLSIGAGIAIGLKRLKKDSKVYVLMGDGEQQEGSVWEAVMSAAHFKLDNLCAVIDDNCLQIDGWTKDVLNIAPLAEKYKSFGWNTLSVDGHNLPEIDKAYNQFKNNKEKPTAIIAKTIKGKGVSFMENSADWHGKAPSQELAEKAMSEIEASIVNF